jgi:hypothetical protein
MLHTLACSGLLFPSDPQPAAPAFVSAKTPDKARLLLDMRAWNKVFPPPPRFPLPKLSELLISPHAPTLFFTKLDVSNFFLVSPSPSHCPWQLRDVRRGPNLWLPPSSFRVVMVPPSRAAYTRTHTLSLIVPGFRAFLSILGRHSSSIPRPTLSLLCHPLLCPPNHIRWFVSECEI